MIKAYEIFVGLKSYLQTEIIGQNTLLNRSDELACIDLLILLAPETDIKKCIPILARLATITKQPKQRRLVAFKQLVETPHTFSICGRKLKKSTSPHLRYLLGCALVVTIEKRLQALGLQSANDYQQKLQAAHLQLQANRQQLKAQTDIAFTNFVATTADYQVLAQTVAHNPASLFKFIPHFASDKLKSLEKESKDIKAFNLAVDIIIVINLCLFEGYRQLFYPQKSLSEFYLNFADRFTIYLSTSIVIFSIVDIYLMREKRSVQREINRMCSLFTEDAQKNLIKLCGTVAQQEINASREKQEQPRSVKLV